MAVKQKAEEDAQAKIAADKKAAEDREAKARAEAIAEAQRRQEAEQARQQAEAAKADALRMQQEAQRAAEEAARQRAEAEKASAAALAQQQAAQAAADQAAKDRAAAQAQQRAAEAETEKARQAAAEAEAEKAQLRAQLLNQLNSILQTRDSARGLIVNMSDVLFDTGSYTLKPGAREKLAKISGIVLAHPGLSLQIEGHTDSVGGDVAEFSELGYARKVAQRYGTEHHEITVGFKDFAEELPFLAWIYDEPMGEPPGIPTYFMCREAKKHVSVMLCGEGADEQFGGYSKYMFDQFSAAFDWMPSGVRNALLRGVASGLPFEGRRLRSVAEILAIADTPRRFASWYGGFDTELQARVLSGAMRDEIGDGGL